MFIQEHQEYSVAKWAAFLQVSRSGYYEHVTRYARREEKRMIRKEQVRQIFEESGGTYGPDRICGILRKQGNTASYKVVSGMMSELGISSVHNRHKTRSITDSRKARGDEYQNLIHEMSFTLPLQAVCSDITYLKSDEGWIYLCVVKDIVSGEILGEAMSNNLKKELVIQAFLNAQARHCLSPGIIFHSDRGSQYTSREFRNTVRLYEIKQSYSRVGMPGDNAWAESFFATLKKECIHSKQFVTRDELRQSVFAWIEGFYNTRRVQAGLGYISPREYSKMLMAGSGNQVA